MPPPRWRVGAALLLTAALAARPASGQATNSSTATGTATRTLTASGTPAQTPSPSACPVLAAAVRATLFGPAVYALSGATPALGLPGAADTCTDGGSGIALMDAPSVVVRVDLGNATRLGGTLNVSTCDAGTTAGFDGFLAVGYECPSPAGGGAYACAAVNDDGGAAWGSCGLAPALTLPGVASRWVYLIAQAAGVGAGGDVPSASVALSFAYVEPSPSPTGSRTPTRSTNATTSIFASVSATRSVSPSANATKTAMSTPSPTRSASPGSSATPSPLPAVLAAWGFDGGAAAYTAPSAGLAADGASLTPLGGVANRSSLAGAVNLTSWPAQGTLNATAGLGCCLLLPPALGYAPAKVTAQVLVTRGAAQHWLLQAAVGPTGPWADLAFSRLNVSAAFLTVAGPVPDALGDAALQAGAFCARLVTMFAPGTSAYTGVLSAYANASAVVQVDALAVLGAPPASASASPSATGSGSGTASPSGTGTPPASVGASPTASSSPSASATGSASVPPSSSPSPSATPVVLAAYAFEAPNGTFTAAPTGGVRAATSTSVTGIGGVVTSSIVGMPPAGSVNASGFSLSVTTFPAASSGNATAGVAWCVSTVGYTPTGIDVYMRMSMTAAKHKLLLVTTAPIANASWVAVPPLLESQPNKVTLYERFTLPLPSVPSWADAPSLCMRLVAVIPWGSAAYVATGATAVYGSLGTMRVDNLTVQGAVAVTPSGTPSGSGSSSTSATRTATPSHTPSPSGTGTGSASRSASRTPAPTSSGTPSSSPLPTSTPSPSSPPTGTPSPSLPPTGTSSPSSPPTGTSSRSVTGTPTPPRTLTPPPTPSRSRSPPPTPSVTPMCRPPVTNITSLRGTSGTAAPVDIGRYGNVGMYTTGSCAGLQALYGGPRAVFFLDLGAGSPLGGRLTVTTCGLTDDNTVLYIGTGCPNWYVSFGCKAGNDDAGDAPGQAACAANPLASTATVAATTARSYFIQLGGYLGAGVTSGLSWRYEPPASPSASRSGTATGSRTGSRSRKAASPTATPSRSGSRSRTRKPK